MEHRLVASARLIDPSLERLLRSQLGKPLTLSCIRRKCMLAQIVFASNLRGFFVRLMERQLVTSAH